MQYDLRDLPSSVQENMDAQVTVRVPATQNRKAYEYTKNTSGSGGGKRKANVGLGVGLAVGSAAILGGLAATAAVKKGQRDQDRAKNSKDLREGQKSGEASNKALSAKIEEQKAEVEAQLRARSADNQKSKEATKEIKSKKQNEVETKAAQERASQTSAKERVASEAAEAKKKKDEEVAQKDKEYRESDEYKAAAKSYGSRVRSSLGYSVEKFAEKAGRDLKKEGDKGKGKKSGGGFAKRNNSLYERIDALVANLSSRV